MISFPSSIKQISLSTKTLLNTSIFLTEIKSAILQMKSSSAPGPDTLTAAIYQVDPDKFAFLLLPAFLQIQSSSLEMKEFTESITTLVPKKVKNITCFDHIHPISLYNVDYKIFSTILSNRVKKTIKQTTYATQIGYQPQWRLHKHVPLLDYLMKTYRSSTFLWIDFFKAFDQYHMNSCSNCYLILTFQNQ
eukprot:TRINITY_DN70_c0_g1_i14.p1 TRINITY_DN70_c0_g1~~TRINITY_DN70_c0_g1_i14.p1  ORF type:complete len:191 (+),score=9.30 TRINITY_DN70_c0_g1_i14:1259-1831(+)